MFVDDVGDIVPDGSGAAPRTIEEPEFARRSLAVRLESGTTVSLPDHIAAGAFSARRLNIIHLRA